MKWQIPAKTFLLGEYAALAGESALILTTPPFFTLSLTKEDIESGIHPDSPAGVWWQKQKISNYKLLWEDPYQGCGGLGASSAQFIAVYLASCALQKIPVVREALLEAYFECAWSGQGLKPSGYDVLAQMQMTNLVYINKNKQQLHGHAWPFTEIGFILLHTGKKLATHEYLTSSELPNNTRTLSDLADQGLRAFEKKDSALLITTINHCYEQLQKNHLVAAHTIKIINELKTDRAILALKGCGALGADIVFILIEQPFIQDVWNKLLTQGYGLIASSEGYYKKPLKNT